MKSFKVGKIAGTFAAIVFFSFTLNFLWESLHGFLLYTGHIIPSDQYVRMMVYMSFMDAVTILGIYIFLAFISKDILWLKGRETGAALMEIVQLQCATPKQNLQKYL